MNGRNPLNGMLCLTAITPLHPGAGSGLGLIDNPIIRERATGFPFIQAPSLKGVLRAAADDCWGTADKKNTACLFGPERSSGSHHEGAWVLNDARILAMPVRSFKGLFVWITSPQALYRFFRDLSMTGLGIKYNDASEGDWDYMDWLDRLRAGIGNTARIIKGCKNQLLINRKLFLEEYEIAVTEDDELGVLAKFLSTSFFDDGYLQNLFKEKLVLLNDEHFRYFVEHATQIEANIAIDQNTGTTSTGSLRYTEFLPEQTLLYSSYRLSDKDFSSQNLTPLTLQNDLMKKVNFLQIGGDGSTGKGFIQIKPLSSTPGAGNKDESGSAVSESGEGQETVAAGEADKEKNDIVKE